MSVIGSGLHAYRGIGSRVAFIPIILAMSKRSAKLYMHRPAVPPVVHFSLNSLSTVGITKQSGEGKSVSWRRLGTRGTKCVLLKQQIAFEVVSSLVNATSKYLRSVQGYRF